MQKFLFCLLAYMIAVSGCTETVPDYTSAAEDSTSPWIDVYGDSTLDMSICITYSDGKVTATIAGYAHPDSINFIQDIQVSVSEFTQQDVPLLVCYGEFPGTTNGYIETYSYASVADTVITACSVLAADQIDYQITRTYIVAEDKLPETLELNYDVKTIYGNKVGKHVFRKYEKEYEQVMRFH